MKKTLLLIVVLYAHSLFSQEVQQPVGETQHANIRITTTPFQFFFKEIPINIEKSFGKYTFGLLAAYRPSTSKGGVISGVNGLSGNYLHQNYWNHLYSGITVGANSKYFFKIFEKDWFIDTQVYYRHWWFENKECSYETAGDYKFNGLRTEQQDVFGIKALIGKTFVFDTGGKVKPIIDVYTGIGLRYKQWVFQTYNGTVNHKFYNYKEDKDNSLNPTLHLGVKIGIGVYK